MSDHLFLIENDALTTPFEDWCEAQGTHPEAFGAWERFSTHAAHTPDAQSA